MPATAEAPPAPPTPAPAPPPAEHAPADFMAAEMADFAEMDKAPPAPPPQKRLGEKEKYAKVREEAAKKAVEKPVEKPAENPTEEPPPSKPEEPGKEKSPMRALGEKYEGLKKQVESEFKPTIQRLQSEIEKLQKQATDPAITEKLKAAEARAEAAEKKLEVEAFTKSTKFENEYEKPYADQWNRAASQFQQLTVKYQDGVDEMEQPIIKTRAATERDLLNLANMSLSDMDEAANKMFGASAPRVIQSIERLKELAELKRNAEMTAPEKAAAARKQEQEASAERTKALASMWSEVNKGLEERFPKAFKPEENDAEDAGALAKGFALADLLLIGNLRPEQIELLPAAFRDKLKAKEALTDLDKVHLHALTRLKIANHDRQMARVKKLQARVAQLEKDLAEFEKSEPGGKVGSHDDKPSGTKDWLETAEDELKALDR